MAERSNMGLLLDVDGTLVDTEALHFRTWQQAFRENSIAFSREDFNRLFGLDPITTVMTLLGCSRERASEVSKRKAELFREKGDEIKAFPGAAALLSEARKSGLLIALVSSTSRADVENFLLPAVGPRGIVDLVVTSEMVVQGKPKPDTLLFAMETLGIAPNRALAAGDTIFDIAAGKAAGVTVVGVSSDATRARALQAAGAHRIAANLHELRKVVSEWVKRVTEFSPGF